MKIMNLITDFKKSKKLFCDELSSITTSSSESDSSSFESESE